MGVYGLMIYAVRNLVFPFNPQVTGIKNNMLKNC